MEEATKQIINNLETQLSQRLEKLWKVFDWCSKILISIIAGVLIAASSKDFKLDDSGLILISCVIAILAIYAHAWIAENLEFEKNIRDELDRIYEEQLQYDKLKSLRLDKAKFGYKAVIILLGCVALAATWADRVFEFVDKSVVSLPQ